MMSFPRKIIIALLLASLSMTTVSAIVYWRETQEITQVIKPKVEGSVTKSIKLPEIYEATEATYAIDDVIHVKTEEENLKMVISMESAIIADLLNIYEIFEIKIIADKVPEESELTGKEWIISLENPSVNIILDKIGSYLFDYEIHVYTGDIEEEFEAHMFIEILFVTTE